MIAARNKVHAALKHFLGRLRGQTEAARGILAVGDTGMYSVLLSKQRHATLERFASRRPDDVANQEKIQRRAF
jgi:hypothetical protein